MTIRELKQQAQELLWKIKEADNVEVNPQVAQLYKEMALVHIALAERRLAEKDSGGWIDALAAVTALGNSQDFEAAEELLMSYRKLAEEQDVSGDMLDELQMLHSWLLRREQAADRLLER